jgi:hypothetical protein
MPDWRAGKPYLELVERAVRETAPGVEFVYSNFRHAVLSLLPAWLGIQVGLELGVELLVRAVVRTKGR